MEFSNHERVLAVKEEYEEELLKLEGVHGVGIGYKISDGRVTDKLSIVVLTERKKDKNDLEAKQRVPVSLEDILTDVVEVPVMHPIPMVVAENIELINLKADNNKYRPVLGGAEIFMQQTRSSGGVGTLGMFARSKKSIDSRNDIYLLSNAHCFPSVLQEIKQPCTWTAENVIADASRIVDSERIDGGIAKLRNSSDADILNIKDIGRPCGTVEVTATELNAKVTKRGRTTETTRGYIQYIEVTANNKKHQLLVNSDTPFASNGDSGSVVLMQEGVYKNYVIGLLWGGAENFAVLSPIKAVEEELEVELCARSFTLSYSAHVMNLGWLGSVAENQIAGTTGQSRRLEAVKIQLVDCSVTNARIKYRVHVKDLGWLPYVYDGQTAGTTGESRRAEAIQILLENLEDYSVVYRVHMENIGWSDWVCDGEIAGTTGESRRIEAVQIYLTKKVI